MKIKRLISFGSALMLSLISCLVILTPKAHAATVNWDGGGDGIHFSDNTNWENDTLPQAGDIINFNSWVDPDNGPDNAVELVNDSGLTFGGLTSDAGVGTADQKYRIDTFTVSGGATLTGLHINNLQILITTLISSGTVTLDKVVVSDAQVKNINISGNSWLDKSTAETMTVQSGAILSSDGYQFTNATSITIEEGAQWIMCGRESEGIVKVNADITYGGGVAGANPEILFEACMGGEGVSYASRGAEFNGKITLLSDAKLTVNNYVLRINGIFDPGQYKLNVAIGNGARIGGTGVMGNLALNMGGELSPGLSPGCLTLAGLIMSSGSTYDAELGGTTACTGYDQAIVNGTVNLGSATLDTILYGGFTPTAGQSFTIINNDGSDAITGTFLNLAEGATFNEGGYVFKISYIGGSGNDVTLTVQSVPASPDTGFNLAKNSPLLTIIITLFTVSGIIYVTNRYNKIISRQ